MAFSNDAFLWYNVPGWAELGLAVPNFGNDRGTQNSTILQLTSLIGRNMQAIMFHTDASLRRPPSLNTIMRVCKLCVRARSILSSRAVPPGETFMESLHAVPAYEQFIVFPVPYFTVRNAMLKEYCGLMLTCLTECFQHQENARPLEISTDFAGLVGQYIQRVYYRVGTELLQVPAKQMDDPAYTIDDKVFSSYNPNDWFTSTEMIDEVPPEINRPTEDDLVPITDGIPVDRLPVMTRYPGSSNSGNSTSSPTTSSASFVPAPSP